jgi:hypothetical protein
MKIRKGTFETNSSSTHSIVLSQDRVLDQIISDDGEGNIIIEGGEYGWKWESYYSPEEKASYLISALVSANMFEKIEEVLEIIKNHTGAKTVSAPNYGNYNFTGYVDHQSGIIENPEVWSPILDSSEEILRFIFSSGSYFTTGNDN